MTKIGGLHLDLARRREIERLYCGGASYGEIARAIGVSLTTIYRELKRGDTGQVNANLRPVYSAELAETVVQRSLRHRGRRPAQ